MTGPKLIRDTGVPREEVLSGELRDEMFAASLSEVVRGQAHEIYQNPNLFFANTYGTDRVRSFFAEVVGRLSGKDHAAAGFFRLDTPFGGGKTHALIGLYHLLSSAPSANVLEETGLTLDSLLGQSVRVVTIVGGDLDPTNGVSKGSVRVHHMWGEIAFQLGGEGGYKLIEFSDLQGTAPGPQFLNQLCGDSPVLLMIDEPAEYMRKMGSSAPQLPAFVKTLSEWATASSRPRVLVMTLAWNPDPAQGQSDAFARETSELMAGLDDVFKEIQSVVSRPARVVTPAERQDIEPILRQRLFESVDLSTSATVADAYTSALRDAADKGSTLPADVLQGAYRNELEAAYPFHPSFIEVLDGKLATIPNFQRTRGALSLVARVIRRIWERGQNDLELIHPFSVDLSDPGMVEELVGRLDRAAYGSVVSYDVANSNGSGHAQEIDQNSFAGHPPYAQRMATTLFLHSLPDPPARGANLSELLASALTPDSDHAHLERALEYLANEGWHLDYEGTHYSFRTEPSLNKIVLDETQAVSLNDARTEVVRRIERIWQSEGLEVKRFPNSTEDLADQRNGRPVLIHWDTASVTSSANSVPPMVQELADYKCVQQEFRLFRNTVFFLVADSDRREQMVQAARRWLGLDGLVKNQSRMDQLKLSREHRERLGNWHKEGELNARIAITRAYRHLYYPAGVNQSSTLLRHHPLNIDDQGGGRTNHTETVLNVLVNDLEQVKTADSKVRSPALVKSETFGPNDGALDLSTLTDRYAQMPRLPLIIAPTYFADIVRAGVTNKTWLYVDAASNLAYDTLEPIADILLDAAHLVMLPEEAKNRGIPVWSPTPPEPKPDEAEQPLGGLINDIPQPTLVAHRTSAKSEGEPRKALADVLVTAKDGGWESLETISLEWKGEGGDTGSAMAHLRALMGQLAGSDASVQCDLTCEFDSGSLLRAEYKGPYQRYQAMANSLESQASQSEKSFITLGLELRYVNGLSVDSPALSDLRDALEIVSLGHTIVPASKLEEVA